jgi:uncharacterized membrane protein YdjX (TVP38/TMEM64 family)
MSEAVSSGAPGEEARGREESHEGARRAESWLPLVARFVVGMVLLFGIVLLIGHFFADEAREVAETLASGLGVWGAALGTLLADGLHFPVPPQFYMLVGIGAGTPVVALLACIAAGSLLGGILAFSLARGASRIAWFERKLRALSEALPVRVREDHPYKFVLATSLTPIPFAWLCYLTGFYGFSKRSFALLAALRLPKLLLYYAIVRAGWSGFGGG